VCLFLLDGCSRRRPAGSVDPLGKLKRRLGLDDGALVGKSVKSVYPQGAVPRLDVDVADCPEAHPPAAVKLMKQPVSQGVHAQAPMIVPQDFRADVLELETRVVADTSAALDAVAVLPTQQMGHQPPPFRQRMLGRGGDFRERQPSVTPRYDVAGTGDLDSGRVLSALYCE